MVVDDTRSPTPSRASVADRLSKDDVSTFSSANGHYALKLSTHLFTRPGKLRQAEWAEFELDCGIWAFLAEKMKDAPA